MCCDFLTVSPLMRSAAVGVWRRTVFLAKLRFYPLNLLYVGYQIRVAYQISTSYQIIIALGMYTKKQIHTLLYEMPSNSKGKKLRLKNLLFFPSKSEGITCNRF